MVILDTSVLIDHLRSGGRRSPLDILVDKYGWQKFSISVVTVQELFVGLSSKSQGAEILELVSLAKSWPYTVEVAKKAGEILRDTKTGMNFADAAIAATCVANNCQLATINKKDFFEIAGLQMVDWE